jgi:hypothetical protein
VYLKAKREPKFRFYEEQLPIRPQRRLPANGRPECFDRKAR